MMHQQEFKLFVMIPCVYNVQILVHDMCQGIGHNVYDFTNVNDHYKIKNLMHQVF